MHVTDEAAAEQFIAAANAFRMQKMGMHMLSELNILRRQTDKSFIGKEAGEAFEKAASVQRQQLNEPDDEANTLTEAFSTSNSNIGVSENSCRIRGLPERRPRVSSKVLRPGDTTLLQQG